MSVTVGVSVAVGGVPVGVVANQPAVLAGTLDIDASMRLGLGYPMEPPDGYIIFYLLASAYEPPEILKRIATDREHPYTHYERKRTRNRWRFFDELHGPVYKTTYVRREYAVGSDQGGTLQLIIT